MTLQYPKIEDMPRVTRVDMNDTARYEHYQTIALDVLFHWGDVDNQEMIVALALYDGIHLIKHLLARIEELETENAKLKTVLERIRDLYRLDAGDLHYARQIARTALGGDA